MICCRSARFSRASFRWLARVEIRVLSSVEIMRAIVDRIGCKLNVFNEDEVYGRECVQRRLACSVGVSPTGVRVRSPVAWIASVEETKLMKPIDKAIFGMVSESPGRNMRERRSILETDSLGGRDSCLMSKTVEAVAYWLTRQFPPAG